MPFTPFHIGPHACASLPFAGHLNVFVFIMANVAVDIEPLFVMLYQLHYPLHGMAHTFPGAGLLGAFLGLILFPLRRFIGRLLRAVRLPAAKGFWQYICAGILGGWLHVLFDAVLYAEMQPFLPLQGNLFLGLIGYSEMYWFCAVLCIPALVIYLCVAKKAKD